jgi:hypothetical protein
MIDEASEVRCERLAPQPLVPITGRGYLYAMSSEDLDILRKLTEEHPDPAVRRAIQAALEELTIPSHWRR